MSEMRLLIGCKRVGLDAAETVLAARKKAEWAR